MITNVKMYLKNKMREVFSSFKRDWAIHLLYSIMWLAVKNVLVLEVHPVVAFIIVIILKWYIKWYAICSIQFFEDIIINCSDPKDRA